MPDRPASARYPWRIACGKPYSAIADAALNLAVETMRASGAPEVGITVAPDGGEHPGVSEVVVNASLLPTGDLIASCVFMFRGEPCLFMGHLPAPDVPAPYAEDDEQRLKFNAWLEGA